MTTTLIFDTVALTAAYSGNQSSAINVGPGDIGIFFDYTKGSSTSLEVQIEVSHLTSPTASDWYTPTDASGTSVSEIVTTSTAGKAFVKWQADGFLYDLISGVRSVRISAKVTGTITNATVSLYLAYVEQYPVPRSEA